MKNLFKTSNRSFAAILTLCILLGIAGTCVYAAAVMPEETVVTEETTQELMPMMARGCDDYWEGQPYNAKSVSDSYLMQNGVNPHDLKKGVLGKGANISLFNIYKDSTGGLWLYSGSGMYIPTYTYI